MKEDEKSSTQNELEKKEDEKVNKPKLTPFQIAEKKRKLRETESFKKKYFEYYDDVKISHREDW